MDDVEVAKIAAGLSEQQRGIAQALCGSRWKGVTPTPGIREMNGLGLMHIDVRKSADGRWISFKAHATDLGLRVAQHLKQENAK